MDYTTLPSCSETNYFTFMALLSFSNPAPEPLLRACRNHTRCQLYNPDITGTNWTQEGKKKKKKYHTAGKVHRECFCPADLKTQVRAGTTISCKIWFYLLAKTASKDSHLCRKLCSHSDEKHALHFLIYNHHCSNTCSFLQYSRILHCDHRAQTPHIHLYLKIQRKI